MLQIIKTTKSTINVHLQLFVVVSIQIYELHAVYKSFLIMTMNTFLCNIIERASERERIICSHSKSLSMKIERVSEAGWGGEGKSFLGTLLITTFLWRETSMNTHFRRFSTILSIVCGGKHLII
jgi:hypothetical protein